jgi:hypothetical protein
MNARIVRWSLRHRGIVTVALVFGLLMNLLVIGRLAPGDPRHSELPLAAHCQGGGPGCAEQPMIPPPATGLPHFDAPPAPVFGALVLVEPSAPVAVHEPVSDTPVRPPISSSIA